MAEDIFTGSLIIACKVIFSKYELQKNIMSDAGGNTISDAFRQFCKCINVEQVTSLYYHHQSNGQVETCITFVKHTMKKGIKTNIDIHKALLQIRTTPFELGLPSPAMLLFSHPI